MTDGVVRVGPLAAIPRVLAELGQDPAALLAELDLDPGLFEDPENTLAFADAGRLLATSVARTGCRHLGLLVGQRAGIETLGLVGMLGQHAPDLGTGLRNLILYLHLHDRGAVPSLGVSEGKAVLAYTIYLPELEATAQMYDVAIAVTCNILRSLAGPGWLAQEILLARARPVDPEPYRRHFRAPIRFDAEQSGIVFAADCLDRRISGRDPQLYLALKARAAELEAEAGSDIVHQVQRVACNLLLGGRGTLESVADVFSIHPRTLNRRLKERGVTFRQIVDMLRRGLAGQLLRDTDIPMAAIAEVLGYADSSAFSRAFHRWTGGPPGTWRAQRSRR